MRFFLFASLVPLLLSGCATPPAPPASASPAAMTPAASVPPQATDDIPPVECPAGTPLAGPAGSAGNGESLAPHPRGRLARSTFTALPRWREGLTPSAWGAFLQSCSVLGNQAPWQAPCADAARLPSPPAAGAMRAFFESHFTPWLVLNHDGSNTGLITGYYEPLLHGSRTPSPRYRYPVYAPPPDLLTVDLGELVPELKGRPLRGRLEGHRVVPYYTRAQIDDTTPRTGNALAWVDNPVELFFLQIQGSGRIALPDGGQLRVGYADQNGHPFRSIGRLLVQRGDLTLAHASLQGIKAWAAAHPDQVRALLDANPSYVFFRLLPEDLPGPIGALGVPVTGEASLAVDPRVIPLGAPVFIDTTRPNSRRPLRRLMLAQDTGGAIHGAVRADFFWGYGSAAEQQAGSMKQAGRLWVLYPRGATPPAPR
ncbi:MAG: murein transglycosylase A [Betaproteobacteria bacterium]|nr:murein transglycosylase A [Betaproteobacteria bacterium]